MSQEDTKKYTKQIGMESSLLAFSENTPIEESTTGSPPKDEKEEGGIDVRNHGLYNLPHETIVSILEYMRAMDLCIVAEVDKTVFSRARVRQAAMWLINEVYTPYQLGIYRKRHLQTTHSHTLHNNNNTSHTGSNGNSRSASTDTDIPIYRPIFGNSLSSSPGQGNAFPPDADKDGKQGRSAAKEDASKSLGPPMPSLFRSHSTPTPSLSRSNSTPTHPPLERLNSFNLTVDDHESVPSLLLDMLFVREVKCVLLALQSAQPLSNSKAFWVSSNWVSNAKKFHESINLPDVSYYSSGNTNGHPQHASNNGKDSNTSDRKDAKESTGNAGTVVFSPDGYVEYADSTVEAPSPTVTPVKKNGRPVHTSSGKKQAKKNKIRNRRGSDALPPWPSMNADLLCSHGHLGLTTDKSIKGKRRLMAPHAWYFLRKFYPIGPQFKAYRSKKDVAPHANGTNSNRDHGSDISDRECPICTATTTNATKKEEEDKERELKRRARMAPPELQGLLSRRSGVPTEQLMYKLNGANGNQNNSATGIDVGKGNDNAKEDHISSSPDQSSLLYPTLNDTQDHVEQWLERPRDLTRSDSLSSTGSFSFEIDYDQSTGNSEVNLNYHPTSGNPGAVNESMLKLFDFDDDKGDRSAEGTLPPPPHPHSVKANGGNNSIDKQKNSKEKEELPWWEEDEGVVGMPISGPRTIKGMGEGGLASSPGMGTSPKFNEILVAGLGLESRSHDNNGNIHNNASNGIDNVNVDESDGKVTTESTHCIDHKDPSEETTSMYDEMIAYQLSQGLSSTDNDDDGVIAALIASTSIHNQPASSSGLSKAMQQADSDMSGTTMTGYTAPLSPGQYYVIPRTWLKALRTYMKDYTAVPPPSTIECTQFLCQSHGLLIPPPHCVEYLNGQRKTLLGGLGTYKGEICEIISSQEMSILQHQLLDVKQSNDFAISFDVEGTEYGSNILWSCELCGRCDPFSQPIRSPVRRYSHNSSRKHAANRTSMNFVNMGSGNNPNKQSGSTAGNHTANNNNNNNNHNNNNNGSSGSSGTGGHGGMLGLESGENSPGLIRVGSVSIIDPDNEQNSQHAKQVRAQVKRGMSM